MMLHGYLCYDNIFLIINNTKTMSDNAWLIMSIMPTLRKISIEEAVKLYSYLIKLDNDAIRLATFLNLKKHDKGLTNKVKDFLRRNGAIDALNYIENKQDEEIKQ